MTVRIVCVLFVCVLFICVVCVLFVCVLFICVVCVLFVCVLFICVVCVLFICVVCVLHTQHAHASYCLRSVCTPTPPYLSPVVLAYPSLPIAPSTPPVLPFIFPTTFSICYFFIDHILSSPPLTCDVPPGGARDDSTTRAGGWQETSASSSHINNGCKAPPCRNTDVCVPTSSTSVATSSKSVPTSSQSASYVCLPLPSHCADPDPVSHGDVVVSGSSQDDVAHVTCDVGYVAAPRNVSIEIVCLVSQCVCVVSRCVCTESVCLVSQYVCIVSQ